jgi:type IV secretion system protein TrbL
MIGLAKVFDFDHIVNFDVAGWIIWIAMLFVALHMMMILIEWHISVLVATVLLPWGILGPSAFLAEFSIGWLGGNLIRLVVTGAFMGVAVPLYRTTAQSNLNAAGDPSVYGQFLLVAVSIIFAILAWVILGRAAGMAGRGLALIGSSVLGAATGAARLYLLGGSVIRSTSSLVQRWGRG